MISRRTFLTASGIALCVISRVARAQSKPPLIGFLVSQANGVVSASRFNAFRSGLQEGGYVEGKNVAIDYQYADGNAARLQLLAVEFERRKVNVIVTSDSIALRAARAVTTSIPIVMTQSPDPHDLGYVASLAHPGGNITGMSFMSPEVATKSIELLKEIAPKATTLAILSRRPQSDRDRWEDVVSSSARSLGLKPVLIVCDDEAELAAALQTIAKGRFGALLARPSPVYFRNRTALTRFANEHKLVSIWSNSGYTDAGGLMSYGANYDEMWHRAASYVAKILKGAKPGELPVEQPTKFELVLNLKAARAIGITIPQSVLVRADRVIE